MRRLKNVILLSFAASCVAATLANAQSVSLAQQPGRITVSIQLTIDNDRPASGTYSVRIASSRDVPIENQYAAAEAIFYLPGGVYHVHVTGHDVKPYDGTFQVFSGENVHTERVRLVRNESDNPAPSKQGSVSSAALNIPDNARKEFEKGMAAFEKQDFDTAQQRLTHAAEIYPQYSLAYVNLGIIAMKQNRQDDGTRYFQSAIKADPQDLPAYIQLSRFDITQKKYSDAEPLLTKAVSISPLNPEALMMLSATELYTGKLDEAIDNAKRVHAVPHQQFAVAHLLAAQAYTKKNELEHAADEYKLFLAESPNSPNAASARAALQSIESRPK